jgi:CheY-like chemotaxis protein/anti-sigma regulatory factor (Ser/Thr protein kinase)
MLESSNLTPAQRQHVSLIRASAETLLQLVEQILDVSKLEASKLTIERIPFAPRATLAEALRPLTPRADRKGLLLRLHVEDSVPDALVGDPVRLRQIVVNLVDNAIKFTDDGEVEVRAVVEPGDTEAVHLHLTVRDTGIGIPRERRKAIFEAFTQADGSTVRTHGGSGLGLTISSRLAALMGGRLWLESEVGRGSTFHATLRCRRAPPRAPGRSGLTGVVALVAEPNQAHRAALVEMLDAWGMVTSQAETANEVVAVVARARDARRPYDVLFIGIDMVGMDGLRVVEHLRASNNFTGSIIMIMRAVARSGDRERCAELGVKAVVTRPLSQSEVFDALALALARPVTSGPALYASGTALYPRRTLDVLLADDNVINREVAMSYLSAWGHRVTPVQDGREALAMLEHHRFDVALLDIHMPGADGFDITRQIRRQETTTGRRLPIVAMTARARHGDRESCLSAGMDGYVAKPVQPELLFDELERVTASAPDFDTALLERAAGDPVLRQRIARLFLDHAPAVRARLHDALAGRDAAGLVDAAHWLKGAIGNLPAPAASEAAARVEILARAGDLEHAAAVCETLDAELDRLATALAAVVAKQRG